jgi:hypothetical protein
MVVRLLNIESQVACYTAGSTACPSSPPEALPMSFNETTSERVARIASLGMHSPQLLTLDEIQTVCASALTQAPDHLPPNALAGLGGLQHTNALLAALLRAPKP